MMDNTQLQELEAMQKVMSREPQGLEPTIQMPQPMPQQQMQMSQPQVPMAQQMQPLPQAPMPQMQQPMVQPGVVPESVLPSEFDTRMQQGFMQPAQQQVPQQPAPQQFLQAPQPQQFGQQVTSQEIKQSRLTPEQLQAYQQAQVQRMSEEAPADMGIIQPSPYQFKGAEMPQSREFSEFEDPRVQPQEYLPPEQQQFRPFPQQQALPQSPAQQPIPQQQQQLPIQQQPPASVSQPTQPIPNLYPPQATQQLQSPAATLQPSQQLQQIQQLQQPQVQPQDNFMLTQLDALAAENERLRSAAPTEQQKSAIQDTQPARATLTREQLEAAQDDPDKLYEALDMVAQAKLDAALPALNKMVIDRVTENNVIEEFFRDDEDLRPHKNFILSQVRNLSSAYPDLKFDAVMGEVKKNMRHIIPKPVSQAGSAMLGGRPSQQPQQQPPAYQPQTQQYPIQYQQPQLQPQPQYQQPFSPVAVVPQTPAFVTTAPPRPPMQPYQEVPDMVRQIEELRRVVL